MSVPIASCKEKKNHIVCSSQLFPEERWKKNILQARILVVPVNFGRSARVSPGERVPMNSTFYHLIRLYPVVFIAW